MSYIDREGVLGCVLGVLLFLVLFPISILLSFTYNGPDLIAYMQVVSHNSLANGYRLWVITCFVLLIGMPVLSSDSLE